MATSEETMVDYNKVFDKLINEIGAAQTELNNIQEQLRNQRSIDSVGLEAATIQEEVKLWKKGAPEGFVEDDEIMYYLAVGQVEELVKELRILKEMTGKNLTNTKETYDALQKSMKEQNDIVKRLENEIATSKEDPAADEVSKSNMIKREELNDLIRKDKLILKQMKTDLKHFIDETAKLDPDYNENDGSSIGYLLQALWKNFLDNGPGEYISIESLNFDVPEKNLEQLVRADIVQEHPSNPDRIKMVDFTMSN